MHPLNIPERIMARALAFRRSCSRLRCVYLRFWWVGCFAGLVAGLPSRVVLSQENLQESQATVPAEDPDGAELLQQQKVVANAFEQLEQKLLDLYQLERDARPARAELLRQMYQWSQSRDMTQRLQNVVEWVEQGQLRKAQEAQQATLQDLQMLMEILQKEDESRKAEQEKERLKEYLRSVKRLLQIQSGLHREVQQSSDPESLSEAQGQLADQTGNLERAIQQNDDGDNADNDSDQESSGRSRDGNGRKNAGEESDGAEGDGRDDSSGSEDDSQDPAARNPSQGDSSGQGDEGPQKGHGRAEGETGEEGESRSPGDSGAEGAPQQNGSGSSGNGSGNQGSEQPQQELTDPLKRAQQRMKQAEQALRDAKGRQAEGEMEKAIQELEAAREALEKILRQAREEEMMSTLARLEDQFRGMLEAQLKIQQKTLQMDQVPVDSRGPDHEIGAARLSGDQRKNAVSAARAAMLLRDDGTSVALAVTVEQLNDDMTTVADALLGGEVGQGTQQWQADIVETLEMLVDSVVQAQQDAQAKQAQAEKQGGEGQEPGEMPLVDQIAELKMLKGLQERILRRHRLLGQQFQVESSPLGVLQPEDARQRLQKLTQQQAELFDITRQLLRQVQ